MVKKYLFVSFLMAVGLGFTFIFLAPPIWKEGWITDSFSKKELPFQQDPIDEKAVLSAKKYIEGIPKGSLLVDETDPSVKDTVNEWEGRILNYAENHDIDLSPSTKVRTLAAKTASLLTLLIEASDRQKEGLDPYTGISGFNTMTLLLTIESEFKDQLGFPFADFFASQNREEIKKLFK